MAIKNQELNIVQQKQSSELRFVKILILGDYGIGKTTLIKTYLGTVDTPHEELSIFELYHVPMKYKGKVVDMGLLDLYPGPTSPERREGYPTKVNVILLCFSVGHYKTLRSVYNLWIHEVRAHFGKRTPIFLIGLRSDSRLLKPLIGYCLDHPQNDRLVDKCEAETIHKKYNFHGDYMECSKLDVNSVVTVIQNAFFAAMED